LAVWYAFAVTFVVTVLLAWILIVYCRAYYLVVGGLLLALLLLALMGYPQFRTYERIERDEG
jgi:hypothetical protein